MHVADFIRHRLKELGTEQRALAVAADVTESYISQLLSGKKAPPDPDRTDLYGRLESCLKVPAGQLASLAARERTEALTRKLVDPPAPLLKDVRTLLLRKCARGREPSVRALFEKEPFGALERLVTQKLLDLVKGVAKEELDDKEWLRRAARLSGRKYEQLRVIVLDFLESDIFSITAEHCVTFLDPLIDTWDIDPTSFAMEVVLNRRLAPGQPRRFAFMEDDGGPPAHDEPGLQAFLQDPALGGTATAAEIDFLRRLRFTGKRPTALYYYRELQNLRDPLHFREPSADVHAGDDPLATHRGGAGQKRR